MATLIDGKAVSASIRAQLKTQIAQWAAETGVTPCLAVVLVGDDPASAIYVRNKKRACRECGMRSVQLVLPAETTQEELLSHIDALNTDPSVHGILVQMPLPRHIDPNAIIEAIRPEKDVDAFHPVNVGRIMTGDYRFLPFTPAGVIALLDADKFPLAGKHCVVIGRSNIVGKPQSMLLLHRNATVTICHSKTENLASVTAQADILVVAIGRARFVTADMVKEGAVVIDVGMNRDGDVLCGDVDFDPVSKKASYITPVPGGVGPMTITTLMQNAFTAAKLQTIGV